MRQIERERMELTPRWGKVVGFQVSFDGRACRMSWQNWMWGVRRSHVAIK